MAFLKNRLLGLGKSEGRTTNTPAAQTAQSCTVWVTRGANEEVLEYANRRNKKRIRN